jgi:hypothetical protein
VVTARRPRLSKWNVRLCATRAQEAQDASAIRRHQLSADFGRFE